MKTCSECGCNEGDCVQRSAVNHRQHKVATLGALSSIYWTAAHIVTIGADGLCQTCRRHAQESKSASLQLDLLGSK